MYGLDPVSLAHSTILCAIETPSAKAYLWMNLSSFEIDEQELVHARELMSAGADLPMEDDAEAQGAEDEAKAAAIAAAAARQARYTQLGERRETGKRAATAREQSKRAAKQPRGVQSDHSSPAHPESSD